MTRKREESTTIDEISYLKECERVYNYIKEQFLKKVPNVKDLTTCIRQMSENELKRVILECLSKPPKDLKVFNMGSRKAIRYVFYWMLREGGQRLEDEIKRYRKERNISRIEADSRVLSRYFIERRNLYTFEWIAIEQIARQRFQRGMDARIGIKLTNIIRNFIKKLKVIKEYKLKVSEKGLKIKGILGELEYDIVILKEDKPYIVIMCKGRTTMGGGHSLIFTRDLAASALNLKATDRPPAMLAIVVAEKWSIDQIRRLEELFYEKVIFIEANEREIVDKGKLPNNIEVIISTVLRDIIEGKIRIKKLELKRV